MKLKLQMNKKLNQNTWLTRVYSRIYEFIEQKTSIDLKITRSTVVFLKNGLINITHAFKIGPILTK